MTDERRDKPEASLANDYSALVAGIGGGLGGAGALAVEPWDDRNYVLATNLRRPQVQVIGAAAAAERLLITRLANDINP